MTQTYLLFSVVTTTAIKTTNKTPNDPPITVDMVYQNIAKILEDFGIYDVDILKELSLSQ